MSEFLKVDGAEISLKTALQWAAVLNDDEFIEKTAQNAIVVQYCAENGISASDEEIQNVFSELRYSDELEKAEETKSWMAENGLDNAAVANMCEIMALRNKVREAITDEEIKEEFVEEQSTYDVAEIYSISVDDEDLANEIVSQLEDEEDSFYNLAVEHSIDEDTYLKGGYVGEVTRNDLRAEAEAGVFAASAGDIVGPIKEDDLFTVYKVLRVINPELDDVKDVIRDRIFEEFTEGLTGTAVIEVVPLGTRQEPVDDSDDEE